MSRDEQERLRDIQDAIAAIHRHLEQAGETTAAKEDPLLHDALLFQFVVIGEAVKNLSPETRESAAKIPWTDIAGLRDLIAHEYFRIDIHRVLEIVKRDLPQLEGTSGEEVPDPVTRFQPRKSPLEKVGA
jgi:uncharacterized protein with HEPN domain